MPIYKLENGISNFNYNRENDKEMNQPIVTEKRFELGFHIFNQWLYLKQKGKNLQPYFEDNLLIDTAIYGMGALGERLYDELKGSDISVKYAIDRIADSKSIPGLKVYGCDEIRLPETDVIIVTPVQDYWGIVELLEAKTDAAIVSLSDIIEYCAAGE